MTSFLPYLQSSANSLFQGQQFWEARDRTGTRQLVSKVQRRVTRLADCKLLSYGRGLMSES